MASRLQRHQEQLLALLPEDGSGIGNLALWGLFEAACRAAKERVTEDHFQAAREALVAAGLAVKGKGRGGSTARFLNPEGAGFDLKATVPPPAVPKSEGSAPARRAAPTGSSAASGEPQVIAYRHADRRVNNPEVGLVSVDSDPEQPKTTWSYDPHLAPELRFDSARARAEQMVDDALAGDDPAAMRHALEQVRSMGSPYLQWTGKAERTSFEVDTVSLHVHERIDPLSILAAVSKRQGKDSKSAGVQPGLFEAPFESVPLRKAIDFYKHDKGWANRMVAGDSLLVMNSLLKKEGMAGQVQMIYIDPPYGIKYGSNFQPFTNKRDVKDRTDADLTQEPEMIKAFRDTWELGIHSYLTYLRDRLFLVRGLLSETGSVFVQISAENVHLVRCLMDEMFGAEQFCSEIVFRKTTGKGGQLLDTTNDYLVWYAKDSSKVKYHPTFEPRSILDEENLRFAQMTDGRRRRLTSAEVFGESALPDGARVYRPNPLTNQRPAQGNDLREYEFQGRLFTPGTGTFRSDQSGLARLAKSNRLLAVGTALTFLRFLQDFEFKPRNNIWDDTRTGGYGEEKTYVVQTITKVIERCVHMTTEPGDLVLDPTCGSGTTAYVAEKLGRRWITCDTSRVAVTLAKQRLMTASFDYYDLRYPQEGLKGGFISTKVPRVTLKSITNNEEIDAIYDRLHSAIELSLLNLNRALVDASAPVFFVSLEGVRKGQTLTLGASGDEILEWEVPFDFPPNWPAAARGPFDAFHAARQKLQEAMDRSIAANADSATLHDKPEIAKDKLRITGPFTVEAVPFPTVLSVDETNAQGTQTEADAAVARSGATSRQHAWRDELLKTGIRGKGGQILKFTELEVLPGATSLHASGNLDSGERVVISFGPEHGALEQRQVEHALVEAGELFPRPKMIVFCAFTFDPEAAKDIDALKGITALKAQMNTDLLTEDLKKARASNQSFWLMGQPDVELKAVKGGNWQVEVHGFDYFDTTKGELVSGGKGKIAAWSLDTDYDGRSLFPHQFFFPMAGKDDGWMKLRKSIRAELDEDLLTHFSGTVSLPFEAGLNRTVAVKIVDDRGIESLKVLKVPDSGAAA
ncbi:MAG: site-specific DNA-methyltransferase [Burkholderiales bacterium]|nr:site-specific DNA-methyltransferase [Burkholderiales bacterium]